MHRKQITFDVVDTATGACERGRIGPANRESFRRWLVRALQERGALRHVYVGETRPLLQGCRLTTWELTQLGVPHTLVADAAGPSVIARGLVNAVVVGADRIAANGDVINKIGTYPLALAAHRAGIPFVVAAPESTVDAATPTGADVHIEVRDEVELTHFAGTRLSPKETRALNYAFDITPAELVTVIVTQRRALEGDPAARHNDARQICGAGLGRRRLTTFGPT